MSTLTLAAKDFRLLRRDYRSAIILLATPLLCVGVLSLVMGEGFWQKPDDRLRVSVVNLDNGLPPNSGPFPTKRWSEVVLDDLAGTADIRIEIIGSREEAMRLIRDGKRSAVLIFEPDFSVKMHRCSFLTKANPPPLNPLYRDGINPKEVSLTIEKDPTQQATASIIEQVAQVTLFRVIIPWMIGKAFERVGDDEFMEVVSALLKENKDIKAPVLEELSPVLQKLLKAIMADRKFDELSNKKFGSFFAGALKLQFPKFQELICELFEDEDYFPTAMLAGSPVMLMREDDYANRQRLVAMFAGSPATTIHKDKLSARAGKGIAFGEVLSPSAQREVGPKVQAGVSDMFSQYNFRAKTWAGLTRNESVKDPRGTMAEYQEEGGLPERGSKRFQILVPSYAVTFSFFLVLTVGWLFVAERRQGTLVRLRAAPLSKLQLLLGKFLPALGVSLFQGLFLMLAGKLIFGVSWGGHGFWVITVAAATAFAATGLSMLVAVTARTESQVAIYGTLLVLLLSGLGGSMMPRELMPETMKEISHATPHAWALDAYQQLLLNPENPNMAIVAVACAALVGFGMAFLGSAWGLMRSD
ncbi:MAG: ABC transporter permease [Gemmataceae bacterium]|nr:ABC transporter permease [Gemmataceae bacterium]